MTLVIFFLYFYLLYNFEGRFNNYGPWFVVKRYGNYLFVIGEKEDQQKDLKGGM